MEKLFEATEINTLEMQNRFVRSATWEGMAGENGACTERLTNLMVELAGGGVGLIISSHTYVSKEGQAGPWQLGIYSDTLMPGLSRMTEAVHERGGRIMLQLAHAGFRAPATLTGTDAIGPSRRTDEVSPCGEMTRGDIGLTVEAFAEGARRARKSGFDGVQIHAAHGYLLSQFLSPAFNRREDDYGGPLENRVRIVLEVLAAIRSAVGPDYSVTIKVNSEDFVPDGFSVDDMLRAAALFEQNGMDAIEMSGGTADSGKFIPARLGKIGSEADEAYYRRSASRYQDVVGLPLMLVGGIRSYSVADQLVESGIADYISLSRPLIREPDLIRRWKEGDRRKADCLSDNLCFKPARAGDGMYCYAEEIMRERRKKRGLSED